MNWITIVGVVFIGIGTFFTIYCQIKIINKNHQIIYSILGVLVIGLGTLLTIYGPIRSGSKDQQAMLAKMDETKDEIRKAISSNSNTTNTQVDLLKIESEFNSWALAFNKNKETMVQKAIVEAKQKELEDQKKRLLVNDKFKPFYESFFNILSNLVEAFNRNTSTDKLVFFRQEAIKFVYPQRDTVLAKLYITKKYIAIFYACSDDINNPSICIDVMVGDDLSKYFFLRSFWDIPKITFNSINNKFSYSAKNYLNEYSGEYSFDLFDTFSKQFSKSVIERYVLKYYQFVKNDSLNFQ